jgi:hypothetical protein
MPDLQQDNAYISAGGNTGTLSVHSFRGTNSTTGLPLFGQKPIGGNFISF